MPCYDHRDHDPEYVHAECKKRFDQYARWLCFIIGEMDSDELYALPEDIRDWYFAHVAADAARVQPEEEPK